MVDKRLPAQPSPGLFLSNYFYISRYLCNYLPRTSLARPLFSQSNGRLPLWWEYNSFLNPNNCSGNGFLPTKSERTIKGLHVKNYTSNCSVFGKCVKQTSANALSFSRFLPHFPLFLSLFLSLSLSHYPVEITSIFVAIRVCFMCLLPVHTWRGLTNKLSTFVASCFPVFLYYIGSSCVATENSHSQMLLQCM